MRSLLTGRSDEQTDTGVREMERKCLCCGIRLAPEEVSKCYVCGRATEKCRECGGCAYRDDRDAVHCNHCGHVVDADVAWSPIRIFLWEQQGHSTPDYRPFKWHCRIETWVGGDIDGRWYRLFEGGYDTEEAALAGIEASGSAPPGWRERLIRKEPDYDSEPLPPQTSAPAATGG
jgi:hypothetical protein